MDPEMSPEQQARLRESFVASPQSRLVNLAPESDAEQARLIDLEESQKVATIVRFRRMQELLQEDSIFGALRRGVEDSPLPIEELAAAAGLSADRLTGFTFGEVNFTVDECDRLAKALHLQLVPVAG